MNLQEEPKKRSRIKVNISAVIVGFALCLAAGYFIGARNTKSNIQEQGIESEKIQEVYSILKKNWVNVNEEVDLEEALIKAMATSLGDPYNDYFTQSEMNKYQDSINLNYEGIGIGIKKLANYVIVIESYKGSNARTAGVLVGDLITKINHIETAELTIKEAADLIRGDSATDVVLTIKRGQEEFDLSITRVKNDYTVFYEINEVNDKKYGMVIISSFGMGTAAEVEKALAYFKEEGIDTIALDLRGNSGGYLNSAVEILDLFLPKGQVELYVEEKDGKRTTYESKNETPYQFVNGYILVNGSTASASEILAGTLQEILDYQLVGTQTYGKGVAQGQATLKDLSVLKYTYARWLLPSEKCIEGEGLTPDIEVYDIDRSVINDFDFDEPLKQDTANYQVAKMQSLLKLLNYPIDREDGYFSEQTKNALMNFETDYHLTVDGEFDINDKVQLICEGIKYAAYEENDQQMNRLKSLIK